MINENLEKLVQLARDKKPTDFKDVLTSELDNRIDARVTEIKDGLSKNMFKTSDSLDEAGSKPLTSKDFKAMANPTHSKSGFTAQAGRFEGRGGVMLDDYVWDDKKMAVKAAQAWIDGFGDSDDYWKNSDKGTKALEKFAKSNKKSWHKRSKNESIEENCEGHPDGVEHTHEDGTVHTHPGGDKEHTHDEEVDEEVEQKDEMDLSWQSKLGSNYDKKKDGRNAARKAKNDAKKKAAKKGKKEEVEQDEGTLPPALQKAIDAKKKNNSDDDDEDKSPVGKKDENIANFGNKKAKAFTDDDNPTDNKKKKDKKEDIRTVSKRILDKSK